MWYSPAAMAFMPLVNPHTGTGRLLLTFEPLPSWPAWLRPQQSTAPTAVKAHVCWRPADTMVTAGDRLVTVIAFRLKWLV